MFCDCSTPRPKSSFRVEEEEEIVELYETKIEEEEETQAQPKEEEEQEIPQEDVSLDKTDENSPDPSAGPSSQENVVVELSEIFAEIVKKKEKEIGK